MLCPRCELPLSVANRQGIQIDYCNQCRGVWLDHGELEKLIERADENSAGNTGQENNDMLSELSDNPLADVFDLFSS